MNSTNEDFWEIIRYNHNQIQFAEIKASAVVSIYTLFITIAYTIDILDEENIYSFSFGSTKDYILLSVAIVIIYFIGDSLANCVRCFLPKLKESSLISPLFFGDIALEFKNFNTYKDELINLTNNKMEYQNHLSHMAYVTGNIAFNKMIRVNSAIRSLIKSMLLFALFALINYIF
jgi:hypothetical protein